MTPKSASVRPVRYAIAGVGSTPARSTSAPALASPATTAASSISPLARGSRPTTATGREVPSRAASTLAAARATESASSGVRSALARPRTPSVPKRRPTLRRSALGVLGGLAGLLQAVLLALGDARVTSQEAGLLQRRTVVRLDLDEGAGDREAQRAGLTADAATVQDADDVVLLALLQDHERLTDELLVHLVGEVLLDGAAVEPELAGAGEETHPDDGLLAAADGLDGTPVGVGHGQCAGHWDTCLISKVWGCWAACGCSGPA